jgi:hypothetical protein
VPQPTTLPRAPIVYIYYVAYVRRKKSYVNMLSLQLSYNSIHFDVDSKFIRNILPLNVQQQMYSVSVH